jgi:hypothetical protein
VSSPRNGLGEGEATRGLSTADIGFPAMIPSVTRKVKNEFQLDQAR